MNAHHLRRGALFLWTALLLAFIFAPIVSTIIFSFNADRFPSLPWAGFSVRWYEAVFADATILRGLINSLIVAGATAIVASFLGFAAAYVDYRYRFLGKVVYTALIALPPAVPVVILGIAMLTFEGRLGLSGTLTGVAVGHIVLAVPFAMALVRMRLADLDPDIERAAWNLGATPWAAVSGVVIPFCLPAILASIFLTAAVSFDEFMIAWFVSGVNETLPVRVLAMLQGQVSPKINAIGAIVFVVSMSLVVIAQVLIGNRADRSSKRT
ncbi:spermidine/putrescine transport system permease protein [Arboricoccus pini]|uniref:Spermidine/putrescine transport system permease protein n=1 Tax=Arboricoccus pini TaxID=1963835 RepID=A0A212RFV2_9PROT|nr:ABC transporter permease [Arboricoccus pini]SNB71251.1 spermidine/putrescine transport system permease protein [Arboricoccus pini]